MITEKLTPAELVKDDGDDPDVLAMRESQKEEIERKKSFKKSIDEKNKLIQEAIGYDLENNSNLNLTIQRK